MIYTQFSRPECERGRSPTDAANSLKFACGKIYPLIIVVRLFRMVGSRREKVNQYKHKTNRFHIKTSKKHPYTYPLFSLSESEDGQQQRSYHRGVCCGKYTYVPGTRYFSTKDKKLHYDSCSTQSALLYKKARTNATAQACLCAQALKAATVSKLHCSVPRALDEETQFWWYAATEPTSCLGMHARHRHGYQQKVNESAHILRLRAARTRTHAHATWRKNSKDERNGEGVLYILHKAVNAENGSRVHTW